ncbi:Extracellular matrix-binding ebh, putative [Babesia ovata]|uniref:Extracellular matrix-binding ebh, putative n=1 Tax=Babesia ovata TaxID=189622 RepID=A0A2H6KIG5_9APIC|nr:Extracellular matrix-binding ebh, putative [Babesia ovata]GBE62769.1 Extracellular matrix-binding ebh, putative [Babesia ovata]
MAGLAHNQTSHLAHNQTPHLALNQEAYLAPNQTAYLAPNQEAYLAPNQTADLVHNQVAYLVHYQEANLWIEAADAAVQAAKVKAENVHGRLDHSDNNGHPKTPIGQGVKQIRDAKDKVKNVDEQLQGIHTDLAVGKARDVRDKLDPENKADDHPIGHNIEKIHTSNEAIKKANEDLKSHVDSLSTWISTAEDIRAKAQQKAEDAYKKLDVNAELSNNVKKIVTANEQIKNVNKSLITVHGNLEKWK